jgi:hypothetical protein
MRKQLVQLVEPSCCHYDGRYITAATKSHDVTTQQSTSFTHVPSESECINNDKGEFTYIQKVEMLQMTICSTTVKCITALISQPHQ